MQIVCTICSEAMNATGNIHATKCGHIFHHDCLMQWINISQTCPQCRNYVTRNCIFRLYLTMEYSKDDISSLESKLKSVEDELQKNKELAEKKDMENSSIVSDLLANITHMKQFENKVKDQAKEIETLQLRIKDYNKKISEQDEHIADILANANEHVDRCEKRVRVCEAKLNGRLLGLKEYEDLLSDLLKSCETKLVSRKAATAALEEEMNYVKTQNLVIDALKMDKSELEEKLQALNGRVKKLALRRLKRQTQKRKTETGDEIVVKRKRSSIYSAIDDAEFTNMGLSEYPIKPARTKSKKMGNDLRNRAINGRPKVFEMQPKIEPVDQNLRVDMNNVFDEYTECDILSHMQCQLKIS